MDLKVILLDNRRLGTGWRPPLPDLRDYVYGFPSFAESDVAGGIPYPGAVEQAEWGHAVAAVGYDDVRVIKNTKYKLETGGALLIRNFWGSAWGDAGYGWLPYAYVLNKLASDFWSLLTME